MTRVTDRPLLGDAIAALHEVRYAAQNLAHSLAPSEPVPDRVRDLIDDYQAAIAEAHRALRPIKAALFRADVARVMEGLDP